MLPWSQKCHRWSGRFQVSEAEHSSPFVPGKGVLVGTPSAVPLVGSLEVVPNPESRPEMDMFPPLPEGRVKGQDPAWKESLYRMPP